jgi:hypothetical protein
LWNCKLNSIEFDCDQYHTVLPASMRTDCCSDDRNLKLYWLLQVNYNIGWHIYKTQNRTITMLSAYCPLTGVLCGNFGLVSPFHWLTVAASGKLRKLLFFIKISQVRNKFKCFLWYTNYNNLGSHMQNNNHVCLFLHLKRKFCRSRQKCIFEAATIMAETLWQKIKITLGRVIPISVIDYCKTVTLCISKAFTQYFNISYNMT